METTDPLKENNCLEGPMTQKLVRLKICMRRLLIYVCVVEYCLLFIAIKDQGLLLGRW